MLMGPCVSFTTSRGLHKMQCRNLSIKMLTNSEMNNISREHLNCLQDLSGIDDIERCREILERNHWDIEVGDTN